jgi:hypothetical protein
MLPTTPKFLFLTRLLLGAALLLACNALPMTQITGAELLAMHLGEPIPSPSDITEGSETSQREDLVTSDLMIAASEKTTVGYSSLSTAQVTEISAAIKKLIPFDNTRTFTCSRANQACFDVTAGMVQLAFHDAGTYDKVTNSGGPDGCVNLDLAENKGLKEFIVPLLAPVYTTYKSVISYADFIVLAANVAINAASSYVVTMPFNWGRTDGTDCDVVDVHRLPEGVQSISHVKAVFVERMGLTLQDITALMGAHTIGRAEDANTGYAVPAPRPDYSSQPSG